MNNIYMLLSLCLTMFVGSFISGLVPLALNLSEKKMRFLTIIGAGLLIGTALTIIIPEGIATIYLNENDHSKNATKIHEKEHSESSIGLALVTGFLFMLIIDQIGGKISHRHQQIIDTHAVRNKITFSTTLGLVVHAAADGIALGAAAATSKTEVEMIIFVAIMLHKAPAAFGLVSFLIHEGLDRIKVRKHLIVFSMAAPVMAIITFLVLRYQKKINMISSDSTGLCLLFSAGTFLYVSTVHVLPEVQSHNEDRQFHYAELLSFVLGAFMPIFFSVDHDH